MSAENGKVCCNCRHNIRSDKYDYDETGRAKSDYPYTVCNCDLDGHYIGYVACFEDWCRHWATDAAKWKEKDE